jgi:hypothetical protein
MNIPSSNEVFMPLEKMYYPHHTSQTEHSLAEMMNHGNARTSFPEKLHGIIIDAETMGFQDIISWQDSGKSFKVHKPQAFQNDIIPKYFKPIKYTSFQRQVRTIRAERKVFFFVPSFFSQTRPVNFHHYSFRSMDSSELELDGTQVAMNIFFFYVRTLDFARMSVGTRSPLPSLSHRLQLLFTITPKLLMNAPMHPFLSPTRRCSN